MLHTRSVSASWSRANEKGVFPGVATPLNWSIWGEIGERSVRFAAVELGLFDAADLEPPDAVDHWMWSIFYGRPAANVDAWRRLYEGGLVSGAAAQRQVFGGEGGGGGADGPGRAIADGGPSSAPGAVHDPAVHARIAGDMRRVRRELEDWWRAEMARADRDRPEVARACLAEAVRRFERADRLHIAVSLLATRAVTELSEHARRAGRPEASNALMIGYPGMEEFETAAALWEVSRGERSLESFLAGHGFHGAQEGEIASRSWREEPGPVRALADRLAALGDDQDPRRREQIAVARRAEQEAALRAVTPAEERAALDAVFELVATFLPLREAGRAALTIALDAMRASARTLAGALVRDGALPEGEDVFLLTRQELLEPPPAAELAERVEARRALRRCYAGFDLPETWKGMPEKRPLSGDATGGSAGAFARDASQERTSSEPASSTPVRRLAVGEGLDGLGASAGRHEGVARVVLDPRELGEDFAAGDVLVAPATDPSWAPLFLVAGAVVIDTGSNISHAAVVAREMGIPAVVAVPEASRRIPDGARLRVDGDAGRVEVLG